MEFRGRRLTSLLATAAKGGFVSALEATVPSVSAEAIRSGGGDLVVAGTRERGVRLDNASQCITIHLSENFAGSRPAFPVASGYNKGPRGLPSNR